MAAILWKYENEYGRHGIDVTVKRILVVVRGSLLLLVSERTNLPVMLRSIRQILSEIVGIVEPLGPGNDCYIVSVARETPLA